MNQTEIKFEDIPTPRTSAVIKIQDEQENCARWVIACQLERELYIAKESLKAIELDKARLDWLEDQDRIKIFIFATGAKLDDQINDFFVDTSSVRVAIDAAIINEKNKSNQPVPQPD